MSKFTKIISVLAASFALVGGSVGVASATPTATLTYAQFLETQGYKDFLAASTVGATYLSQQSGVEMAVAMKMTSDGVETPLANVTIKSSKTVAQITMSVDQESFDIFSKDGVVYTSMSAYKNVYGPDNITKVLARVPGSANKIVKFKDVPEDLAAFTPEEIFSPNGSSSYSLLKSSFADSLNMFQFSEVTSQANSTNPGSTDYAYDMVFSLMGMSVTVHSVYTLDEHSMIVAGSATSETATPNGTMSTSTSITMAVNNDVVINIPDTTGSLEDSQLMRLSHQITAEGKSTAKANAIVKKATELAKKAKAQVSSKHLADAAKTLKYQVTKIPNGVKLSATVSKVQGNLCVTAVKGKTSIKNC